VEGGEAVVRGGVVLKAVKGESIRGDVLVVPGYDAELRTRREGAGVGRRRPAGALRAFCRHVGEDREVVAKRRHPGHNVVRPEVRHDLDVPRRRAQCHGLGGTAEDLPRVVGDSFAASAVVLVDNPSDQDAAPPTDVQQRVTLPEEAAGAGVVARRLHSGPLDEADAMVHRGVVHFDPLVVRPCDEGPRPAQALYRPLPLVQDDVLRPEPPPRVEHQLAREARARDLPVLAAAVVGVERHRLDGTAVLEARGLVAEEAVHRDAPVVGAARDELRLGVEAEVVHRGLVRVEAADLVSVIVEEMHTTLLRAECNHLVLDLHTRRGCSRE